MTVQADYITVIGAGPAGLAAAEVLAGAGRAVRLHEAMPSVGRKLLMAGRGGLNLTHSEPMDQFVGRYREAAGWMGERLEGFDPAALVAWTEGLGQPVFTGSSGRVFPKAMKASPLLRAWLGRLNGLGVDLRLRSAWRGWDETGALVFETADGRQAETPAATVLALGGASWPRLGSTGAWAPLLAARGVEVAPFRPANMGFTVDWSEAFRARFAGQPLKGIALTHGDHTVRGEAMVAGYGLEGGGIYALSASLREAIAAEGSASLTVDLKPDQSAGALTGKLARPRGGASVSNFLRKAVGLSPAAIGLLREAGPLPEGSRGLALRIKALPLTLTGTQGLERAISSAGGIALGEVDERQMLSRLPGVFVAGEMLDWEAPTGGYLLQGCMATGMAAGRGVLAWLEPSGR
jgi:uncharacterized flavoprotein (TIGR03862 family)